MFGLNVSMPNKDQTTQNNSEKMLGCVWFQMKPLELAAAIGYNLGSIFNRGRT